MKAIKQMGTGVQAVTVTLDVNEMLTLKTKVLMFRQSAKDGAINDALLRGRELCNFMDRILPCSDVDLEDVHYRLFSDVKQEEQEDYDIEAPINTRDMAEMSEAVKPSYMNDEPNACSSFPKPVRNSNNVQL